MNPFVLPRRASLALLPIALIACSHDNRNPGPSAELPTLTAGAHAIVVDGDSAAHDGTAFVGSKGQAYAVFTDNSNAVANVVYRRSSGSSAWRRVPAATADLQLSSKLDAPMTLAALTMPAAATHYRVLLGDTATGFTLAPDGTLAADADSCKLSGKLASADLANAASAALTFAGCASGDGDYEGVAYVDPDAPNAVFHVVVDNGSAIRDFYAYAP